MSLALHLKVYFSQLIFRATICSQVDEFDERNLILINIISSARLTGKQTVFPKETEKYMADRVKEAAEMDFGIDRQQPAWLLNKS